VIDGQDKKIATLQELVSLTRVTQERIQQSLANLADVNPVNADQSAYTSTLSEVSTKLEGLRAQQAALKAKFEVDLETLRNELLAELRIVAEAVGPAREEPPAPASAPLKPAITKFAFPFDPRAELDGIIAGLTRQAGGNVAEKGVIAITASGCIDSSRFAPKFAADLMNDSVFVSGNEPNQWIAYDFLERRVRITHYTLRSRFDGWINSNNPKSWVIEISLDGQGWTEIDRKEDNGDLNGTNLVKSYELGAEAEARVVRIRQIGPTHSGKHFLTISGFELFGAIVE
jgi:hypothetical protein